MKPHPISKDFSFLAIMLVAAFSFTSASATELIVNGGFESGLRRFSSQLDGGRRSGIKWCGG